MKLKKRLISLLLAVALFACIVPPVDMTAHAAVSAEEIVAYARQYIGHPYVKGGVGPKSFDCSGFVSYVFKHFGIEMPKGAGNYFSNPSKIGKVVGKGSIENAQMGDIIAWSGHVAIYTEDGYCVEALGTKYGVLEKIKVNRHRSNGMNYKVIRVNGVVNLKGPKISSLTGSASGVEIKWDKISDAKNYRVFRKDENGSWKKLADTASTSYVDKSVKAGKKYSYTVCCLSKDGKTETSKYDAAGKSITYTAAPKLSAVTSTAEGIKLSWSKTAGAQRYGVFYKASGDSTWYKAGDTTSTSYVWTKAKSGADYKFTVRCITGDAKAFTGGYNTKGLSIHYIAAPKLTSVSAENNGTVIKWGKVADAARYSVFYKTGSGGWTKIADTASTSYTWADAESGTKYTFTVRCLSGDGKSYVSAFDATGKSLTPVDTPKLTSISNTTTGVNINWKKVSDVKTYRVYYKENGESTWHNAGDSTSASFTWTGAESGADYRFTVRVLSDDGKAYRSGYDTAGLSIKYIEAPQLVSVTADNSKTVIKWNKVNGAEKYGVFRKVGDGGWEKLAETAAGSYTDATAKLGSEYYYTVRCISGDGKSFVSAYRTGLTAVKTPVVTSLAKTVDGISVNWNEVPNAVNYRVFYKANDESTWHIAGDTASTSYTWAKAKSGNKYSFTVRCISGNGLAYTSSYDDIGKSVDYIAAPKISSVSNTANGVQIKWGKVAGAEKYAVFYKNSAGKWKTIAITSSESYEWKGVKSGTEYTFTVRCITKNGVSFTSAYDETGRSVKYVAAPKISSLTKASSSIQIKWGKVAGAEKYRVFYKANGESTWHKLGDTDSASYTWTKAKKGVKYSFTVRCISKDGSAFTSSYDEKGKSITK